MADMFEIGLSGVRSSQAGLLTTGHNIANINTKGYSRQNVEVESVGINRYGKHFVGSGSIITGIERAYDKFSFTDNITNTSKLGYTTEVFEQTNQLDSVLSNEDTGVTKPVLAVFEAINGVADHPNMLESREVFLESSVNMVNQYNRLYDNLESQYTTVNNDITETAKNISALADDIAELNGKIAAVSSSEIESHANDLMDKRDQKITELSKLVNVSVVDADYSTVNVYIGTGQSLVVGDKAVNIIATNAMDNPTDKELAISINGETIRLSPNHLGGKIAGLFDTRNNDIKVAFNKLGQNIIGLTHSINEQQKQGQTLEGKIGEDLFNDVNSKTSMQSRVLSHNDGLGSAQLSLRIDDLSELTPDDYELVVNDYKVGPPEIIEFNITNQTTGSTQTLGPVDLTKTKRIDIPHSGLSLGIDAILADDPLREGKTFTLQPTRLGAQEVSLQHHDASKIAAADAEIKVFSAEGNKGNASLRVSAINEKRDPLYMDANNPLQIVVRDNYEGVVSYDILDARGNPVTLPPGSSNHFQRSTPAIPAMPAVAASPAIPGVPAVPGTPAIPGGPGEPDIPAVPGTPAIPAVPAVEARAATPAIPASPAVGIAVGEPLTGLTLETDKFTGKATFSVAGIEVEMSGTVAAGDTFSLNYNETGDGDNRNIMHMSQLQTQKLMNNNKATFQDVYSGMISEIGSKTASADVAKQSAEILQNQSYERIQSNSGVNMDEEAANLLKYQQHYSAAARVISIASELFETILQAAR